MPKRKKVNEINHTSGTIRTYNHVCVKIEFPDDSSLIPKNTSLIIARIPLAIQPKKPWDPTADKQALRPQVEQQDRSHIDLSRMNGSEEDKIHAMMMQSTIDYDPHK